MYQINPFFGEIDFGTLVVELLFEDGAGSGTAANTGTLGGTYVIAGPTGPAITIADAYQGTGSLTNGDDANPSFGASDGHPAELIIGTANFSIEVAIKHTTFTSTFGHVFWGWESGSPTPLLAADTAGNLIFGGGPSGDVDTGVDITTNVWHTYKLRRRPSGITSVVYDGVVVYSVADTSDYNNGFSFGSFRVGCHGNSAGGIRAGFIDQFRFYNGNV